MLRFLTLLLFITIGSTAFGQTYSSPEATSATDGDVRIHNTKKSRFSKATRARKSERITEPAKASRFQASSERKSERINEAVKSSRYRAEAGGTERSGKSYRKSGGVKKLDGESRVFKKRSTSSSNQAKKAKVRRSLGRSNY